jgi:predicted transcriptional regulator
LMDRDRLLESILGGTRTRHAETPKLIKVNLANYFAGALLLSYGDFFREVQRTRYDVGAAEPDLRHHLRDGGPPSLQPERPEAARRALPLPPGRTSRGTSASATAVTGCKFASGGSCGKWAVHLAFLKPSQLTRQYSMMPDGTTYFCFAKVQLQPDRRLHRARDGVQHRAGDERRERPVPRLRPAHHGPAT